MKVLHFIASVDKTGGGTTAYMQLLSIELKNILELIVVTGTSPNPIELKCVDVRFLDISLFRWFLLKKEILELLKIEKPEIVHINGIWMPQTWLFQKCAQKLNIEVVLSPHGMLEPYILARHPLKKKIALALYQHKTIKKADYLHATAESELRHIRNLGYTQPAAIIPNGIDLSEVKVKTHYSKVKNILFMSRIHPKKGIELLIEAVSQINPSGINIIIAGEGDPDYVNKLKNFASEKGCSDKFNYIGGVYGNEKWELLKSADLFVLPTFSENFGIVVAEALAIGIPVITTTGTPWQELKTQKCGWWIDLSVPNLVKALSEAIEYTPEQLKEMGLRGRKLVEEKYDIKTISKSMVEFYNQIRVEEN